MSRICLVITLLYVFNIQLKAQLQIHPLEGRHTENTIQGNGRVMAAHDTLSLPFFDDFSTYKSSLPDDSLWEPDGGTYINNRFCFHPPTLNVASFDGLDAEGKRYKKNASARGLTDELVSRPIDLAISTDHSAWISFFWQPAGRGHQPDSSGPDVDSLNLMFRDTSGTWRHQWSVYGDSAQEFKQAIVPVNDSAFRYEGFQFRFRAYGRQSGMYDVWHVDYIYLDTGRTQTDTLHPDVTISESPVSLLKPYTSMPASHFVEDRSNHVADSVIATVNNLFNDNGNIFNFVDEAITDTISGAVQDSIFLNGPPDNSADALEKQIKIFFMPSLDSIEGDKDYALRYKMQYNPVDGVEQGVDYRKNDSVVSYTHLKDYFAYDDGSAEYGIGVNEFRGEVAVKYTINHKDTLTDIDIHFPRVGEDHLNERLKLKVWKKLEGIDGAKNDKVLFSRNATLEYADSRNGFITYHLDTSVVVNDSFYIGWQQFLNNDKILAGFDVNTNSNENIYYNTNFTWSQLSDVEGSIMIRPVFGDSISQDTLLPVSPSPFADKEVNIYPNPSKGKINIRGPVQSGTIYSVQGKRLQHKKFISSKNTNAWNLTSLQPGTYIIRLELLNGKQTTKKLLLR